MSEQQVYQVSERVGITSRNFLPNVFLWMFMALSLSATFAYFFSTDRDLLGLLLNLETGKMTTLGMAAMFAPLVFVLLISSALNRFSYPVLAGLFAAYAALTGISLSFLLLVYSASSVVTCFISSATLFAVMAVAGYTTKQDLTHFGAILKMFLIGIVIASLVNFFLKSSQLDYIVSFVGVAVFVGLTAYDVQKLKRIGAGIEYGDAPANKMVIMGALTLYLDFINLFIMMLRLFGGRRDH